MLGLFIIVSSLSAAVCSIVWYIVDTHTAPQRSHVVDVPLYDVFYVSLTTAVVHKIRNAVDYSRAMAYRSRLSQRGCCAWIADTR